MLGKILQQKNRKTIVSGKLGEAALKFYPDGTFLCTVDTIPDNLKVLSVS